MVCDVGEFQPNVHFVETLNLAESIYQHPALGYRKIKHTGTEIL
jgi:hypothetical protein